MTMKEIAKTKKTQTKDTNSKALGIVKGLALAYAITCVVFIVYALLLTYTELSDQNIPLVAMICTVVATVVAGITAAKNIGEKGLVWGCIMGILYAVVLFVIAVAVNDEMLFDTGRITTLLISAAGGGIGGILGINAKK